MKPFLPTLFLAVTYCAAPAFTQDPGLGWSSYLGGSGFEAIEGAARTSTGDWIVVGNTTSSGLATPGAYQITSSGSADAFAAKISSDGSLLLWFTYLGGTGTDEAWEVAVDNQDRPVIVGYTESNPFASTALPGYDQALGGLEAGFLCRLTADGSAMEWWTLLDGFFFDEALDLTLGPNGDVFACGFTDSWNFPVVGSAAVPHSGGNQNAFLMRFDASGSALLLSTCLGGLIGETEANALVVDPGLSWAMICGETTSPGLALVGAFDTSYAGGGELDGFVARIDLATGGFSQVTYLGGSDRDVMAGLQIRGAGEVFVVGDSDSHDFPTTPGAYQTGYAGRGDVVVARLTDDLSTMVASTYVGIVGDEDEFVSMADGTSGITIAMSTNEPGFPMVDGAWDHYLNDPPGRADVLLVRLDDALTTLEYSSHLGGSGLEVATSVVLDQGDQVLVTGITTSANFPMRGNGFDSSLDGFLDSFLAEFTLEPGPIMSATNLQRGQSTLLQVDGVAAGETVYFALGLGGPGFGLAPSGFGAARLDILSPVLLGVVGGTGVGTVDLSFVVPPSAPLTTVHLQSLVKRGTLGDRSLATNLIETTILP